MYTHFPNILAPTYLWLLHSQTATLIPFGFKVETFMEFRHVQTKIQLWCLKWTIRIINYLETQPNNTYLTFSWPLLLQPLVLGPWSIMAWNLEPSLKFLGLLPAIRSCGASILFYKWSSPSAKCTLSSWTQG